MRETLLNNAQLAVLLAKDPATTNRFANSGKFGKPVIAKGKRRKFYRLAAVEAYTGKKFTPEEVAKAEAARDYSFLVNRNVLWTFAQWLVRLRDRAWSDALAAQGITDFTPPPTN